MNIANRDERAELERYLHDLRQIILTEASLEDRESMLPEAFTAHVLDILTEVGEWPEANVCYHRQHGAEISGWGWDDETGELRLSVTIFTGTEDVSRVSKRDADAALNRLSGFLRLALGGLHRDLEEASTQFDAAYLIHSKRESITDVKLYLLTDRTVAELEPVHLEVDGLPCSLHQWGVARLHRVVTSGQQREPIDIHLTERYGTPLPCLPAQTGDEQLKAYLLVFPGKVLADLYDEFGPRLLELNVRSFLQARGKVNRGIRDTLTREPDRFFAYNNGISATAKRVEIGAGANGAPAIHRLLDFQIVNGGQTTASIATTARKNGADLSNVFVQAKLTEVPPEHLEEVVPLISRYANSQNAVSEADLSSNHSFHVAIEELSRTVWAPAPAGGSRETRWFYERSRGQYQDAISRERTPARRKAFREVHPPRQKFTKTDLAKFENTWSQRPHIVSRGAQKSFVELMAQLKASKPDLEHFHRLCAKALIFRNAERIVSRQDFGGYRANIVTYTLSLIFHRTAMRVDLDSIWRNQALGPGLESSIEKLCPVVHRFIADPPGGQNVTEWCKKEKCWTEIRQLDFDLPVDLESECIDERSHRARDLASKSTSGMVGEVTDEESREIRWAADVDATTWYGIASWAKDTSNLQPWQRKIAFSLGRLASQDRQPSVKQAKQGRILHDSALELGYRPEEAAQTSD